MSIVGTVYKANGRPNKDLLVRNHSDTLLGFAKIFKRGCGKGKNKHRELKLFVPNPSSEIKITGFCLLALVHSNVC